MQQTNSSSKVKKEPSNKNKKLNSSRNVLGQQETVRPIARLKSTHQVARDPEQKNNVLQPRIKPRSSMGKRPMSSKHTQTVNSMATTTSAKSQGQVKQMINSVFSHSKNINKFLDENNLEEQEALQNLLNNELFTLSLVTMLGNKNADESKNYVECSCLNKLKKTVEMNKQVKKCDQLENRICKLIDNRIKQLSKA